MTEEEMKARIAELEGEITKANKDKKSLLDEKVQARKEAEAAREAAEAAAEEAARKTGDAEAIEKAVSKRFEKQLAERDKLLAQRDETLKAHEGKLSELLIDNTIKDALNTHNIAPHAQKMAAAYLRQGAKLDPTEGVAKVGDLTLADHIASWATSDEAKAFIAAPMNSGGGATGARHASATSDLPSSWNLTKYAQMKTENPAIAAAYAQKHGKSFD